MELEKRQESVKVGAHGLPSSTMNQIEANNEASQVQLHSSSKFTKLMQDLGETVVGKQFQDFSRKLKQSESPILTFFRTIRAKTKLSESETVLAIKKIRTIDPKFTIDKFFDESVHFIIPDLLEAHLNRDLKFISKWFSEAV